MCGESKKYCSPDVPAEAVKSLSSSHAHASRAHEVVFTWQAVQLRTTQRLLPGSMSCYKTGSIMKLLGSSVVSLHLAQRRSDLLVQNRK